jgi:polyphosphate kinase 2 (PPK2 family)
VLFEDWDASGKGGGIRRLVSRLDPRHVRVTQFGPPSPDERRHHFLHRFSPALPGWGGMAVRRFRARERDPLKRWKLTGEDWRNLSHRADYA